jgi:broad specificity phosphatase PhoE
MGTLVCVRHGQASFGAANYDQLSELGERQARRLGEHWAANGLKFDAIVTGTLARHRQTLEHLLAGLETSTLTQNSAPNSQFVPEFAGFVAIKKEATASATDALNEYDSEALIRAQLLANPLAQPLGDPHTPEGYKQHFRVLRQALKGWIGGSLTPMGMSSFAQFRAGIAAVAEGIAQQPDQTVLMVSSGGPISTLVMHVLRADPLSMIDLNYQMNNTAVTRFHMSSGKLHLSSFNALPHLDAPECARWRTST